jgi:hypothetical protein
MTNAATKTLILILLLAIFAIGFVSGKVSGAIDLLAAYAEQQEPATAASLRSGQIRTRHLTAGAVTSGKIGLKSVTVNVTNGTSTGSSAADPDLAGGTIVSCDPSGNQDQHMDNHVLNADGSITVTLAANATATNNFRCVALKADAKGVS